MIGLVYRGQVSTGWLDRFRLGLVDYESALYLSPYNE